MKKLSLIFLLLGFGSLHAQTIAYQVPAGKEGTQNYGGALGMDFIVNAPILKALVVLTYSTMLLGTSFIQIMPASAAMRFSSG